MEEKYELVITKLKGSHCSLGSDSCSKCKRVEVQGEKFMLLSLELRFGQSGEVLAQPLLNLRINGKLMYTGYVIKKIFNSEPDAMEYSQKHNVKIVENAKR